MTAITKQPLFGPDPAVRRYRLRLLIAVTLGYGLIYTCRLALGIVKKPLIDQGIFTPDDLGVIGSGLFYAYAFGKLTNGFLADHIDVKKFLIAGLLLSAACNFAMGFATDVTTATVLWSLNGWFQSFCAPCCVIGMTAWFTNEQRGRAYGIWSTSHSIGEGATFLVVSLLVGSMGWRYGFFGPAMIGIAAAGLVWALFTGKPADVGLPPVGSTLPERPSPMETLRLQLSVLRIPAIWILALASALAYVTRYAINSWGVLYLQESHGLSLELAGTMLMLNTLAGIIGAIGFGYISDTLFGARRPPVNLIFALVEITGLLLIFYGPHNMAILVIGMVLFGFGMTGLVTSVGGLFAVDVAPKAVVGATLGMIGMFSYLGSAMQERISGRLIDDGMTVVNGVRHYDFTDAIQFWIGCSIASMFLALLLWRARAAEDRAP